MPPPPVGDLLKAEKSAGGLRGSGLGRVLPVVLFACGAFFAGLTSA